MLSAGVAHRSSSNAVHVHLDDARLHSGVGDGSPGCRPKRLDGMVRGHGREDPGGRSTLVIVERPDCDRGVVRPETRSRPCGACSTAGSTPLWASRSNTTR
jgi:hypothetical protein